VSGLLAGVRTLGTLVADDSGFFAFIENRCLHDGVTNRVSSNVRAFSGNDFHGLPDNRLLINGDECEDSI